MTEAKLILSDQIEGYPHPKLTETLYGHEYQEKEFIDCYNCLLYTSPSPRD